MVKKNMFYSPVRKKGSRSPSLQSMIVPSQDDDTSGTDSESETEIDKGKNQGEDQGKKSVGDVHKSGSSSTSKGKQNVPQQPLASLTKKAGRITEKYLY